MIFRKSDDALSDGPIAIGRNHRGLKGPKIHSHAERFFFRGFRVARDWCSIHLLLFCPLLKLENACLPPPRRKCPQEESLDDDDDFAVFQFSAHFRGN
jgi:hypothetical protein